MKVIKTGLILIAILISKTLYCNQTNRIRLSNIDFYSANIIDYNLIDTIAKNGQLELDYKMASRFSISYTYDSLSDLECAKYKIIGFDYDWIKDTDCKTIMIPNLESGYYTLSIAIFNQDEIVEQLDLDLIITPPFWKTWYFKFIQLILFFGIFGTVVLVLIIKNSKLNNKLKELN